ncbi:cytochrome [Tersicoccus phoenicis]|uniref:cytochrome n=1 Tax=Tersicoccus phoenicis TaxID=554083 RepID=UPI000A04BD8F|nr:cytochrome [Tersicoccus phoenicis]
MTQPRLAHQTEHGRMYSRSTNTPPTVPSITTVIAQQAVDLTGWSGYMAANHLASHPALLGAANDPGQLRSLVREAASAAEQYRNTAAERGDRVHFYCEQIALQAMGRDHRAREAREDLAQHGEHQFADRFDEWWSAYGVEPLAAEATVWNHDVGYAGTLDLIARIGGRVCLIDFKTRGTDRDGFVKALDEKVVMQLTAGMKAQEWLVDAEAGTWESFPFGANPLLLPVAIGQTEVRPMRARDDVLAHHWYKFCSLRRVWETTADATAAGRALLPIAPPPAGGTVAGERRRPSGATAVSALAGSGPGTGS